MFYYCSATQLLCHQYGLFSFTVLIQFLCAFLIFCWYSACFVFHPIFGYYRVSEEYKWWGCLMEHSASWEANRSSASWQIPCVIGSLKVHYCIYKSSPPVPIRSQTNPVQAPPPHPISWQSILILIYPLCQGLPSGLFHSGSPVHCYMPHPSHSWFDYPNTWWGYSLCSSLCPCYIIPLRPQYPTHTLFSNTWGCS